jgi:tetratricopeptide (TPR) repeat protein
MTPTLRPIVFVTLFGVLSLGFAGDVHAQDHGGHDTRGRTLNAGAHTASVGSVSFKNSGATAAQKPFQLGVALLHNFEYEESAEAFCVAQQKDPALAMAYWMEALTYIHTTWSTEDVAAARAALTRLGATPEARLARARTPRERAYGAAVEALVADNSDERSRVTAYADSLAALERAYPGDLEAKAFASIARVAANYRFPNPDRAQQRASELAAAELADTVYRQSPLHPGGAHYAIHAFDSPDLAVRGLAAARAYARIAPDAEHALHMPSHIFVQLGMWKDASQSDERAYASSRRGGALGSMHSLNWLQYAYTQQGRFRDARALLDSARATLPPPRPSTDGPDERYAESQLAFRYAMETGDWIGMAPHLTADTLPIVTTSMRDQGMARFNRYQGAVVAVLARSDTIPARVMADRFRKLASSAPPTRARWIPLGLADQLDGLIAQVRGDTAAAIRSFERASASEDSVPPVGPPSALVARELLGNALLVQGHAKEAAVSFGASLIAHQNRAQSLLGLARAQRAMGDEPAARATYRKLAPLWVRADPGTPGLDEVHAVSRSKD